MRLPIVALTLALAGGVSLAVSNDSPLVHMLVPGFTVRELPVRLSNLNNLRFAPDGRLFALGYDGRIHVLRDTNGDGLEDAATLFWDQPTLSVPVGLALAPEGVYVSSHGKVSLLRDPNGDDKADTEEIIARGWPPTDVGSGGVDASALTRDPDGNIYFGLLVADYSNPYRLRKRKDLKPEEKAWLATHGQSAEGDAEEEVSLYDINSVRGTIQKWSPKTKKLDTIATGIRVPYALAFNQNGDLFVTDQEGETWCPNGNPLDELNHIIPGRNYGFPPRHEKWLPNLVSEPPVVAFGPQHQSTCGLVFNEPKAGQGLFGPKWWEGDAFVAGESRGKIWRVRLVKTPHGYVGKEYLIARLSMLTTDVAISPKGDLYVSCHSGLPDWGTGPQGAGRIFCISYKGKGLPLPTAVWPKDQTNVIVSFYGQLARQDFLKQGALEITYGAFVTPAEQYEVLKPPYEVVRRQSATPRSELRIYIVEAGEFQLRIATEPHPVSASYALSLPQFNRTTFPFRDAPHVRLPPIPAEPAYISYDFHGVLFTASGSAWVRPATNSVWYPHLIRSVTDSLTRWSERHSFDGYNRDAREYRLNTWLNYPSNAYTLELSANRPFMAKVGVSSEKSSPNDDGNYRARMAWYSDGHRRPLEIVFDQSFLGKKDSREIPRIMDAFTTSADDPTPRVIPLTRLWLPYAPQSIQKALPAAPPSLDVTGGDYERGRELFFGDQLKCATCHRLRGKGGAIGPDLGNLVARDAGSVLRDIKEPSATINPDFVAYQLKHRDGSELTGFIRTQDGDSLRLVAADGKETAVRVTDMKELRPSSLSLMPAGLLDTLKDGQIRDLLTFLVHEPPKRTRAEVESVLASNNQPSPTARPPLRLVLVANAQDHGPGQHDYPAWQKKWATLLGDGGVASVTKAWEWPAPDQFQSAEVLVFYYWNRHWDAEKLRQLDDFLARGGGVVVLHSATIGNPDSAQLAGRIGLASDSGRTKYLHTPLVLQIVAPTNHPITRGLPSQIHFLDEPYWPLIGDAKNVEVLATTEQDG